MPSGQLVPEFVRSKQEDKSLECESQNPEDDLKERSPRERAAHLMWQMNMLKNKPDNVSESVEEGATSCGLTSGIASGRPITRRTMLKDAGAGIAGGLLAATVLGNAKAEALLNSQQGSSPSGPEPHSGKTPISLIIDDGGPVDAMFFMQPGYPTPLLPSVGFFQRVADTLDRFDVQGKMTVLPMPSCLGRIDQSLRLVPQSQLEIFLKIVRERIAPRLDITPEFLTHLNAYNLKSTSGDSHRVRGYQHIFEDVWISGAPLEEIVEYFSLAFTILKNVGLNSTGITSPWMSGIDVEPKYAQALSEAQWKTLDRKHTWYFLHTAEWGAPQSCEVTYESPERDRLVVSVPANFPDLFWSMDLPKEQRQKFITDNIDRVLSPDGRTGRLRELVETGYPVTLLTHWQSLHTQGTELGLEGLNVLLKRIQKEFGSSFEWVSCSERARRYVASTHAGA
jgi:hypothetical protein